MASDLAVRWEKAKKDFTALTGKKKPKPNGMVDKAFNHSGLSGALKDCDKKLNAIEAERDPKKKMKLVVEAEKHCSTFDKAAKEYIKRLDAAAKDEIADKNDKTVYARGLKFLRDQLDSLDKKYDADVDKHKVALDQTTSATQKAAKMVHKALASCCANAAAGVKKIKANPTPQQFDEIFKQSDNVARKVQVQLIAAANAQKKGLLPSNLIVDPRFIADKLTPWQAGGKGEAVADLNWDARQVLAKTDEFSKLLKLSGRFLVDLEEHT